MEDKLLEISYRLSYGLKYAWVKHKGLQVNKEFYSSDEDSLKIMVELFVNKLNDKWNNLLSKQNKKTGLIQAEDKTKDAFERLEDVNNILIKSLDVSNEINFEKIKDYSQFDIENPENSLGNIISDLPKPIAPNIIALPQKPKLFDTVFDKLPEEPKSSDFKPNLNFVDKLINSNRIKKNQEALEMYHFALENWKQNCEKIKDKKIREDNYAYEVLEAEWKLQCERINAENKETNDQYIIAFKEYEINLEKLNIRLKNEVGSWEKAKNDFIKNQEQFNNNIDKLNLDYNNFLPSAIVEYSKIVLNNSTYPDCFPKNTELEYNRETKILIVEYSLPSIEDLPKIKEVKYIKEELKEYYLSEIQMQNIFENTMYKVTLRTIYELFTADKIGAIDAISFNGWVNGLNKASGKKVNNCILSIQVKKSEFLEIDLRHVDPKICFKNLKGVGSSKLSGMTPIQPIMQISKADKRFTSHYDVADKMDDTTNLAAMDWEDFEHLIREVFGKEFSSNGGEVKVTQASRDGGVDAIAFDPDPIRGGKIIIQAKRYTNTVGVSAVRDLFGTVMNEGANKGILVTTADYGPDAYEFVKGKPLTLMNGANLLYLLEKHGHKAKIDIAEARRLML